MGVLGGHSGWTGGEVIVRIGWRARARCVVLEGKLQFMKG
jgi:hypothetical protein